MSKYEPGCLKNLSSLKLKMTLINTMIVLKIQTQNIMLSEPHQIKCCEHTVS